MLFPSARDQHAPASQTFASESKVWPLYPSLANQSGGSEVP